MDIIGIHIAGLGSLLFGRDVMERSRNDMEIIQSGFGRQWILQRAGYFEADTIYGLTEDKELADFKNGLEINDMSELDGKIVLDAGCGSGRLTASIGKSAPGCTVLGIDISDSVYVAQDRSRQFSNVHIIRCDLRYPPFLPASCDLVWSEGVLHHTPNTFESFKSLSRLVKAGGKFYLWVYPNYIFSPYKFLRKLLWKPYRFPPKMRYAIAVALVLPIYVLRVLLDLLKIRPKPDTLRTMIFRLYDCFSPEYQHYHSKEEVQQWFDSTHEYKRVKISGDIGALGEKFNFEAL